MDGLKELAYLYTQLRKLVSSMPASIDDMIDPADWFQPNESEDSAVWQMIEKADKAAKEILK